MKDTSATTRKIRVRPEDETVKAVGRLIPALERQGRTEDPWMAADMLRLAAELEDAAVRLIASYRARGDRWEDIGFALGITGTTAVKRYAKKVAEINAALVERIMNTMRLGGGPGNKRDRERLGRLTAIQQDNASRTARELYDGTRTVARCWSEAIEREEQGS